MIKYRISKNLNPHHTHILIYNDDIFATFLIHKIDFIFACILVRRILNGACDRHGSSRIAYEKRARRFTRRLFDTSRDTVEM